MKNNLPECFHGLKNFEEDRLLPLDAAKFVTDNSSGQIRISATAVKATAEWVKLTEY